MGIAGRECYRDGGDEGDNDKREERCCWLPVPHRPICSRPQFVPELLEERFHAACLDGLEGDPVDSRGPVRSFPDAWITKRGAPDDDDNSSTEGNISNTRVRLQSNGVGDVKANGLCPATGCPSSNALPVRVYCAGEQLSETLLHLNGKGDGKVDLIFSLPCNDPAVLARHWLVDEYAPGDHSAPRR